MSFTPNSVYRAVAERNQRVPLVFAAVSGSHLYGFESPDSDYDIRGAHVLAIDDILGLGTPTETIDSMYTDQEDGVEIDIVTHDIKKFLNLLLAGNGNVLEQVMSPHLLYHEPYLFQELLAIARLSVSKKSGYHYLGFAESQWKLFNRQEPKRVKPLLYVFRTLLTGLFMMETGRVVGNLRSLASNYRLHFIDELIHIKLSAEHAELGEPETLEDQSEYEALRTRLEEAIQTTSLPDHKKEKPTQLIARAEAFLIRVRHSLGPMRP